MLVVYVVVAKLGCYGIDNNNTIGIGDTDP